MFKFNNTNIITGYIKQLLTSFNLPKYYIYTQKQKEYHRDYEAKYNAALSQIAAATKEIEHQTDLEKLSRAKEQLENAKITLAELHNTKSELNVFSTIYRNSPVTYESLSNYYAGQSHTDTNYPERMRYMPYIKDGVIQEYANKEWHECHATFDEAHNKLHSNTASQFKVKQYNYNQKEQNYTKNLIIKDNIYDSYTHEYLGNFLRFQRDYTGLDLMPLYNCFSNRVCSNLDIKIPLITKKDTAEEAYLYNVTPLELGTLILNDYTGKMFIYGGNSAGATTDKIDGANGVYNLTGYNYFTILNGPEIATCSSIRIYKKQEANTDINTVGKLLGEISPALLTETASNVDQDIDVSSIYFKYRNSFNWNNKIQFKNSTDLNIYSATFQTADPDYKIFMIPVKLFKDYTIAIDSEACVEMCCGIYGKYQDKRTRFENIPKSTYACFNTMQFRTPRLYTGIQNLTKFAEDNHVSELAQHEDDLKLFIKVPIKNKSSIAILEGDYTAYNDTFMINTLSEQGLKAIRVKFEKKHSKFIPYVEHIAEKLISPFVAYLEKTTDQNEKKAMQEILDNFPRGALTYYQELLEDKPANYNGVNEVTQSELDTLTQEIEDIFGDGGLNEQLNSITSGKTEEIRPIVQRITNHTVINFESKKIELVDNLITPLQLLRENTGVSYPFADRLVEYLVDNAITPFDEITDNIERAKLIVKDNTNSKVLKVTADGLWTPALRLIFYAFINNNYNVNDINHDILGYVDKDVEAKYSNKDHVTISRADIYDAWEN